MLNIKLRFINLYKLCLSETRTKKQLKLCGCEEKCFKRGKDWGHYESVMCKHLTELQCPIKGKSLGMVCDKTYERVLSYETKKQYDEYRRK